MNTRLQKRSGAVAQLKERGLLNTGGRINDTNKYITVDVSGASGTFYVMDSNTKKLVGVTNFDGNKLNAGRHIVIDALKIEKATAGTTPAGASFIGDTTLPKELSNCEFRVVQKGLVPIDFPVNELNQPTANQKSTAYRDVSTLPVLVANEEISMEIQFPVGVTAPAGTIIKVSFDCHQIKIEN
ncbi:hypothetical protein [Flavobacterium sp.]|uniref:hypothetical protein n=1 Tax=Flavobacterium sp. TaxID=239 RepID=UPI00374DD3C2